MLTNFLSFFGTFLAFVAGVTAVSEFVNDLFKVPSKPEAKFMSPKQIVSWVIAVGGACLGFVLQLGFFADFGTTDMWQGWVMTGLTGICAGLAANGIYDINAVHDFLKWVFQFMNKPKVINE